MVKSRALLIDNYDSFTYNLFQYLAEIGGNPIVYLNDKLKIKDIEKIKPTHIVISPGPGTPVKKKDFGICGQVIRKFGRKIPLLGVCLGHQGICHVFGGKIIHAPYVMHGKTSLIKYFSSPKPLCCPSIFKGIPKIFKAMRYHSLIASRRNFPKCLLITAQTARHKLIMGVQHKKYPIYGIQFHPESIGTPYGKQILKNFLSV